MQYALIENGQVTKTDLPQTGYLKDGSSVSGYNGLPEETLIDEGWLPLENIIPEYNPDLSYLQHDGYIIQSDKVVTKYIIVDRYNINDIKIAKKEELWKSCTDDITNGFYSDADGTNQLYGFNDEDKSNMIGIMARINIDPIKPIFWKTKNSMPKLYTVEQFKKLYSDCEDSKTNKMMRYFTELLPLIDSIQSVTDVQQIAW